ncbi:hypothetical protein [Jeotgalibacillus campisalis]|uniref:DUF2178 domain-containing protein n=1 Tax=Jeotgalibacillus campisalis TaxID=220754 RepID=A0A0C2W992_9BACL|nr:hypothetical protein [Jeotgalibacillus campisalis]KIL53156.1 hypothetical protein KR50_04850 [Jeotgalibacillus campisalis]
MKKIYTAYLLAAVGIGLLAVGVYFIKTIDDLQGLLAVLPYLSVGIGCVIFGHGMGEIVLQHASNRDPAAAKDLEIEKKDERNIAISNRAKAKSYDMMIFLISALLFAVAIMGIDLLLLLLFAFTYFFIIMYTTYYRYKYYKEM